MKLHLGCRTDILPKKDGWVNLDIDRELKNVDVFHDLEKMPYPFEDDRADEIRIWNVLEHIRKPSEVLAEMHRICKNGARVHIKVPHFSQGGMWGDETHVHGCSINFMEKSIEFSGCEFRVAKKRLNYRQTRAGMGKIGAIQNAVLNPLINLDRKIFERYFLYYFGGVEEIEYLLEVVK
ncbi:hypothetical protein COV61_03315 [Candidatus Micrarchaeota archaeon CG11_big_fil_rev_8_21_14_0_20_47_5]|nr:MAG: hypothetical protein AUJ17_05045 [Candidatus Micrarchaeota archaeon CG1_02_47_40]PIN83356.1 MAG: hypothetical protein COV61_03315 [Candidatus Micrarchaeota archaeon CG11_big_fil_rev_8_21_14_0_20_47_5]